jgi:ppGpp synthetase/RelA/SpoT-type nucleotidyltranferase
MKVPSSIRRLYQAQIEPCTRLKSVVDQRVEAVRQPKWHYESRLKSEEDFALKLETGRFTDTDNLEDFFGCMLVVTNSLELRKAEQLLLERFELCSRRPPQDNWTHKSPDSFPFDDLRLYMRLKDDPALPPTGLEHIVFEFQIRTFLQHAWSIAVHDLIYKSPDVDWNTERIAFQIKAMLEHAELSIQEAETLAKSSILGKTNKSTKSTKECIALLQELWGSEYLPRDVRRLASNILKLLEPLDMSTKQLKKILSEEKSTYNNILPINLSPYATIVQSLFRHELGKMEDLLTSEKTSFKVVIVGEVDLPEGVNKERYRNAIFIPSS